MDLSPETLRQVEFREQWRGYSQDEVDDFLERVAVAVAALQDQLAEALDRATQAERRLLETSAPEDELRRTLVLAQRTADAARQEAEEEAARTLGAARAEAERLVRDAEGRAREAEEEARRALRAEVEALAAARDALSADVEQLRRHVDAERERLRAEAERLIRDLGAGGPVSLGAPPPMSDVEVPPAAPAVPEAVDEHAVVEPHSSPGPEPDGDRDAEAEPRAPVAETEAPTAEGRDEARGPAAFAEVEPEGEPEAEPEAEADVDLSGGDDGEDSDGGDDTGEIRLDQLANGHEPDDDPFLAELRRAVTDTEPLGPRDDAVEADEEGRRDEGVELYDQDLSPSSRFRLRRRR